MGEHDIVRGTSNVFADLGLSDAAERQEKTRLALAINAMLDEQGDASAGLDEQQLDALRVYALNGFSLAMLQDLLSRDQPHGLSTFR